MSSTAAQHNVNMFKYQMAKQLETCKQCKATQSRNCDWQWNSNLLTEMDGSGQQHRARIHDYNGCIYWFSPIVSNSVNDILTGILTLQKTAKHSMTRMMSPPSQWRRYALLHLLHKAPLGSHHAHCLPWIPQHSLSSPWRPSEQFAPSRHRF